MGWFPDRSTFDRLVLEQLPACQRFALRLTGDPAEAEEVVQEAMLHAARSWRSFRGEARMQTWLFRILINAWRDRLRRRLPSPAEARDELLDLPDARLPSPHDHAIGQELGLAVAAAVRSLPPRQREVLILSFYEQLPTAEIARTLDLTEQNVRTILHLARQRLRTLLQSHLPEATHEPR